MARKKRGRGARKIIFLNGKKRKRKRNKKK
jgi:hypothetical protein